MCYSWVVHCSEWVNTLRGAQTKVFGPKSNVFFEVPAVLPPRALPNSDVFSYLKKYVNSLFVFQNRWIIVPVIAMGMETACPGLAIASLASWALIVAEVGIYT